MPYPDDEILTLRRKVEELTERIRELEKKEKCEICGVEIPTGQGLGISGPESKWKDKSKPRPIIIRPLCLRHVVSVMMEDSQ